MTNTVDLSFRVFGKELPLDHGYFLYSSISKVRPDLHEAAWLGIHPVGGIPCGAGQLQLTLRSRLSFRLPAENIPMLLNLGGKRLVLGNGDQRKSMLTVGVPEIYLLEPEANLFSRCVAIKLSEMKKVDSSPTREMFISAVETQLEKMNIKGDVWIDDSRDRAENEISRRVIRIKQKAIVCYSVHVRNLSNEDSLRLQTIGLGGRRRMGCGLFLPTRPPK